MGSCFRYLLTSPCRSCSVVVSALGLASGILFSITSTVADSWTPSLTTLRWGFALDSMCWGERRPTYGNYSRLFIASFLKMVGSIICSSSRFWVSTSAVSSSSYWMLVLRLT